MPLRCDVFIDDLPEILAEPDFRDDMRKILFDPENQFANRGSAFDRHISWAAISADLARDRA